MPWHAHWRGNGTAMYGGSHKLWIKLWIKFNVTILDSQRNLPRHAHGYTHNLHTYMCGIHIHTVWAFASLHWTDWQITAPTDCRTSMGSQEWGCGGLGTAWQSMCLPLGTKCIYLRQQWLILTLMPRPAAFLSPGTSSMNRPLSTGEGEHCQDSMPPCWIDIVLCFYYIFCLTLHLIMYICRSMLPYYYYSFIGFSCGCCCFNPIFYLFKFSCLLHLTLFHITTCLHLYLYSSACSFVNYWWRQPEVAEHL